MTINNYVEWIPLHMSYILLYTTCIFLFQRINAVISRAAKTFVHNHIWYLCPELVVLGLFDKDLGNGTKIVTARMLLQSAPPAQFLPGKPGGRHFEQVIAT